MPAPTSSKRRSALGPRNSNIAALPKPYSTHPDTATPKRRRKTPNKRPIEFPDDVQLRKLARCVGTPIKLVGVENWLEGSSSADGSPYCPTDTGAEGHPDVPEEDVSHPPVQPLASFGVGNFASQSFNAPTTSIQSKLQVSSSSSSTICAATVTLRLRLRVALFKVQTNQTAIPLSHLQLPEPSPQPLSVFPPSLVRISPLTDVYDEFDDDLGNDEIESATTLPPSSPPPLVGGAGTYYAGRRIPFTTGSSSPSPNRGRPIDFGSSSDVQEGQS